MNRKFLVYFHRLKYESFKGHVSFGIEIDHKDGRKCNNEFDNLEEVSSSENTLRAFKIGLMKPLCGKDNHMYGKKMPEETRRKNR